MKSYLALAALALAPLAFAQGLKLQVFDNLKDKASDATDLNLPKELIKMGVDFLDGRGELSERHPAKPALKKLVDGLSSILVKSLEFDKEGVYNDADVKQLIAELGVSGWNLIISVDEKKEKSRIWMKSGAEGEIGGMRIMSAEPKELTVVEIIGKIRAEDLKDLGSLGIPNLNLGSEHGQPAKKNKE